MAERVDMPDGPDQRTEYRTAAIATLQVHRDAKAAKPSELAFHAVRKLRLRFLAGTDDSVHHLLLDLAHNQLDGRTLFADSRP
jgi:hypothetical protein